MATISVEIGGYSIRAMVRTANETLCLELGDLSGQYIIPSAFAKDNEGKVHVGYDAIRWKYNSEFISIVDVENDEQLFTKSVQSLVCYIIYKAKKQISEEINRFVFVVPNYYGANDPRKSFIKNALSKLGIYDVSFITVHEALCLSRARIDDNKKVLVFDMGRLGLNISLLKRKGNNYELLSTRKVDSIGGLVFDGLIYRDIMRKCNPSIPENIDSECLWNDEMERISTFVKERLSTDIHYECPVPCSNVLYVVTRKEFEEKLSSIIGTGYNSCQNMVSESNVNTADIAEVLLWGGSCRIPIVLERCNYLFMQINPSMRISNCTTLDNSTFFACKGGIRRNGNLSVTLSF